MYRVPQRSDPSRGRFAAPLAVFLLLLGSAPALQAQVVRVTRAENLRIEPNGALLGALEAGAELRLIETRDTWVQAELEGWVWARSLQMADRDGFDLVVSADGGENLRERPQGAELAFLEEGALLEELERIPGWILVRRRGWIWRASVEIDESVRLPVETGRVGTGAPADSAPADSAPAGAESDVPAAGQDTAAAPAVRPFRIEPGTVVRRSPDGDTLAVVDEPGRVAIVGSEGAWARVLMEGWVRLPEGTTVPSQGADAGMDMDMGMGSGAASASGSSGLDIDAVVSDPAGSVGAVVNWDLQFISLERAGPGRPEFSEGEAYLLMRPAGEGTGRFVYVVVPESVVEQAEAFVPLERLSVRGRIRTGASAVTGGPVVDLVEMTRRR